MKKLVSTFLEGVKFVDAPRTDVALLTFSNLFALNLQLPTSAVANGNEYYVNTHLHTVEVLVSELNEAIVINVPVLMDLIRQSWLRRYESVFMPFSESALQLHAELLTRDPALNEKMQCSAAALVQNSYYRGFLLLCDKAMQEDAASGNVSPA